MVLTPLPYVVVYAARAQPSRSCTSITVRKTGTNETSVA